MVGIVEQYIRQRAPYYGIDPNVAARVAGAEAMNVFDPSQPDRGGDGGSSFGPFQLHYGGLNPSMPHAGLGDDFTAATGLDARDPSTWQQQVDFALSHAAQGGWSPWMGAKAAGVSPFQGIGGTPTPIGPPDHYGGNLLSAPGSTNPPMPQAPFSAPPGTAVAGGSGDSNNLGLTGQQGQDIASILDPNQNNGQRLQSALYRMAWTPNAPAPALRGMGDARASGNDLLKALQSNGLNLTQLLTQQRLVG